MRKKNDAVSSPNGSYIKKYRLNKSLTNKYSSFVSNPIIQADERTAMGIPIPCEENVEYAKEYQEENKR